MIETNITEEDIKLEGSLRPQTLDDYIGQSKIKENLKVYITADEVQSINHLAEEDSIRTGQTLIVPYYSYEFVK